MIYENSRSIIIVVIDRCFFENCWKCWKLLTFDLYNAPRIYNFPPETTPEVLN